MPAGIEVHAISTSISTVSCVIDEDRIEEVTARLNEVYADHSSSLDPALERAQADSVGSEEW